MISSADDATWADRKPSVRQPSASCCRGFAEKLTGAVRYFDGLTNDARLVLDTLASAARHGRHQSG